MKIPLLRHFNPVTQLFGAYALFLTGIMLTYLLLNLMVMLLWPQGLTADSISDDSRIYLFMIRSTIGPLLAFIGSAIVFRQMMEFEGQDYLRTRQKISLRPVLLTLVLFMLCSPVANFLLYVNFQLDPAMVSESLGKTINGAELKSRELLLNYVDPDPWKMMLNLFSVGLITAIGEEFFFRGIIQRLFIKMLRHVHLAVIISAMVFALMHADYYRLLPRFFMGLALGYLLLATGSIWYSVLFHFINNGISILFMWMQARGQSKIPLDEWGYHGYQRWVALAILAGLVVFTVMRLNRALRRDFVQEIKDY